MLPAASTLALALSVITSSVLGPAGLAPKLQEALEPQTMFATVFVVPPVQTLGPALVAVG